MRLLSYIFDLFLPRRLTARIVDEIVEEEFVAKLQPVEIALEKPILGGLHLLKVERANGVVTTLLPYTDKQVQACILEAKFHRNECAISLLGAVLREYFVCFSTEEGAFSAGEIVIIPLPLSPTRRKERGHNQVESVVSSAMCGKTLERIHINSSLLVRVRNTVPQTTLSGVERRKNLEGAFGALQIPNPNHTYILVDDVTTTGSTLAEAIKTLRANGAVHLFAIALANSS